MTSQGLQWLQFRGSTILAKQGLLMSASGIARSRRGGEKCLGCHAEFPIEGSRLMGQKLKKKTLPSTLICN